MQKDMFVEIKSSDAAERGGQGRGSFYLPCLPCVGVEMVSGKVRA